MKKRFLATFLALFLVLGLLPGTVWAAEQITVHASTTAQLKSALKSNTKIVLDGKDYLLTSNLELWDLENVTIQGTEGTRIISSSPFSEVLFINGCKNLVLDSLVLGHDDEVAEEGCTDGVIVAYNSELTITNCDIFGCGRIGIETNNSTVKVEKSIIRDCSQKILDLVGERETVFRDCVFSGNGYDAPETYAITNMTKKLAFYDCTFKDNKNPRFVNAPTSYTVENCTFINNGWGDNWKPITPPDGGNPDPDLPKLSPPVNLRWGGKDGADRDNIPGCAYWNSGSNCQDLFEMEIHDANKPYPSSYMGAVQGTNGSGIGDSCYIDAFHWLDSHQNVESGTYYFIVKNLGDGNTWADSDFVRSDNWTYVKPEKKLETVSISSLQWSWPELSWSAIADSTDLLDYRYTVYFSETEDGMDISGTGLRTESPDITKGEVHQSLIDGIQKGYYHFQVRAMSKDITVCQDSEWTDFSPKYYYQAGGNTEEKPGDLTGDGKVTMTDVIRLARGVSNYVTLTEQEQRLGDVTGDGKLTMADVIRVARFAAGYSPTL